MHIPRCNVFSTSKCLCGNGGKHIWKQPMHTTKRIPCLNVFKPVRHAIWTILEYGNIPARMMWQPWWEQVPSNPGVRPPPNHVTHHDPIDHGIEIRDPAWKICWMGFFTSISCDLSEQNDSPWRVLGGVQPFKKLGNLLFSTRTWPPSYPFWTLFLDRI